MSNGNGVNVRFVELSTKEAAESVLYDGREMRFRIVQKLYPGAVPQEGEGPLGFWLRCIAEENDLPVEVPACGAIRNAVYSDPRTIRLVFFLS